MDFIEFKTGKNDEGRRIDKVIRIFASEMSLSQIYKCIRKGLIKINDKKIKSDYKIQQNDTIQIASFLYAKTDTEDAQNSLEIKLPEIVFQNQHLLILNKPYDMLVHGSDDSLDKIVCNYYKQHFKDKSLSFTPGPLHRIDRKTTGLIAFSLSLDGAHWFTENIQNHNIKKKYYGIVEGNLAETAIWKDEIKKNEKTEKKFHTVLISNDDEKKDFKESYTAVTPVLHGKYKNKDITLCEFDIKTGRTHQIRAQSGFHNHPLLGDTAYGGTALSSEFQSFYLQAYSLSFPENNPVELPDKITIPLNDAFVNILKSCGINRIEL